MALWWGNTSNNGSKKQYDVKYALSFRRGAKDEKPSFSVRKYFPETEEMGNISRVVWTFEWIIYNDEKQVTSKDWKSVTIPAKFALEISDVVDGKKCVYYVEVSTQDGTQLRPLLNSLLSMERWNRVEINTYISKWYKVIWLSNPDIQKEITFEKNWEKKTAIVNDGYSWSYKASELPEVEVIKNKAWEIKSVDDSEQLMFLHQKIEEKFMTKKEDEQPKELDIDDVPF